MTELKQARAEYAKIRIRWKMGLSGLENAKAYIAAVHKLHKLDRDFEDEWVKRRPVQVYD